MRGLVIVVQLVLTLVLVATFLPAVLVLVPRAQNSAWGPAAGVLIGIVVFLVLRVVWPARKS